MLQHSVDGLPGVHQLRRRQMHGVEATKQLLAFMRAQNIQAVNGHVRVGRYAV